MKPKLTWDPIDPLGEVLHFLRMSGVFYCRSELTAPWALALPSTPGCLSFHVVVDGRCHVEVEGSEPLTLVRGDLALVTVVDGHRLASEVGVTNACDKVKLESVSERYTILRHGGGGAATTLVCGAVRFAHPAAQHLLKLLPKVIRVAAMTPQSDWMRSILQLMEDEAQVLRPGGETVITRLADILVIQAVRSWIEHDPAAQTGWLRALQDPRIGRAITLIHRDPARAWTLASLANEVAMSRSAFAARFNELVGEPAMQYVTRWRMHVAVTWLHEESVGVGDMAARLGYQSEAAFSRAFKRFVGVSPGSIRRNGLAPP